MTMSLRDKMLAEITELRNVYTPMYEQLVHAWCDDELPNQLRRKFMRARDADCTVFTSLPDFVDEVNKSVTIRANQTNSLDDVEMFFEYMSSLSSHQTLTYVFSWLKKQGFSVTHDGAATCTFRVYLK